ncbi:DUF2183 domain-containing protein [Calidifontibacter sp. DB0510]|uniref:DUF2183 domain-containing protein n=1 Tax=Metallococcus carri TaxID=1656884 RepID=A0A967B7N7_9MICO|nr:phosphatase domain-containing protein [Metallococcus carri]NHN56261.1 DUF2183 domain-containing protein [Metallococcus carri]NOP38687.1 DUF2183 domain-containing protein [Calidifontibacter sp. DB2511S]
MAAKHPAARAEDAFNGALADVLGRRGWQTRLMPFTGYGGAGFARVLARVVLARDGQPGTAPILEVDSTQRGFRGFLAAPLTEVPVTVRLGAATIETTSDRGGYVDVSLSGHGLEPGWHPAEVCAGEVTAYASVQIIGPEVTFGIISDIDDTCLITSLPRPLIAAWNTFVRQEAARRVVPGMAAMYRSWLAHHPGAPIVYLSTGAWNTWPTLSRFFRRYSFPLGPLLLTDWGATETSFFRSGPEHKRRELRRLAREFPQIRWRLVGDDGQHDPELYTEFARDHPESIDLIAIRELTVAQQLLSHGSPMSRADDRAPVFKGPDGYTLHRLVHRTERAAAHA